jgi:hypothetical protein
MPTSDYVPIYVISVWVLIKTKPHLKVWIGLLVLLILESVVVDVSNQSLYKEYFSESGLKYMWIYSQFEAVTPMAGQLKRYDHAKHFRNTVNNELGPALFSI